MDIASIKPHHHHHHADFDYPVNPSPHAKNFLNGINDDDDDDGCIEMIALQAAAAAYTSLKDLTPTTPSSIMSPSNSSISSTSSSSSSSWKDSWREIPIKDPLLQHAAWAYLQPMAPDRQAAAPKSFFHKLMDQCGGIFGCFNGVVVLILKLWEDNRRGGRD